MWIFFLIGRPQEYSCTNKMIEPTVICYYNGAGGMRLSQYLCGAEWDDNPGKNNHYIGVIAPPKIVQTRETLINVKSSGIWLDDSSAPCEDPKPIQLTHCMTTDLIRRCYPGRKIIKIKCDLKTAVARYWDVFARQNKLQGKEIFNTLFDTPDFDMSMFYYILYRAHHEFIYYQKYPVDWQADVIYDLDRGQDEFSSFMRIELQKSQSKEYLEAWEILRPSFPDFTL